MSYPGSVKGVLISKETTYGTFVTPSKDFGIVQDAGLPMEREVIESHGLGQVETQAVNAGMTVVKANPSLQFQNGRILEFLFGSVSHVDTSSDTKHTFTISESAPGFSYGSYNDLSTDTGMTLKGCRLENAEFSMALNEIFLVKLGIIGIPNESVNSAQAAVIGSLPVFPHAMCHFKINGSEPAEIQEASITVNTEVKPAEGLGSNVAQSLVYTKTSFEWSAKLGFDDYTYQNLFLGGTVHVSANPSTFDVEMNAHNGVTLGSGRREFYLKLSDVIMSKHEEIASVGNLTFVDLAGNGKFDSAYSVDNIATGSW